MDVKITMDLIRELEKDKEGRILLRDLRRSTELWQDYNEVKREVIRAKEKKKMKHTAKFPLFNILSVSVLLPAWCERKR